MVKKEGKVYDQVYDLLKAAGYTTLTRLEVATTKRGAVHLVVLCGYVIGEYNHVSKKLSLYGDRKTMEYK